MIYSYETEEEQDSKRDELFIEIDQIKDSIENDLTDSFDEVSREDSHSLRGGAFTSVYFNIGFGEDGDSVEVRISDGHNNGSSHELEYDYADFYENYQDTFDNMIEDIKNKIQEKE